MFNGYEEDGLQVQRIGFPGEVVDGQRNVYMFNGDFVDRGGSGYQVVYMLAILTLADVDHKCVYLNRGNHESELFGMAIPPQAQPQNSGAQMGLKFL